jgi:putative exporter of polyketide antibiotics
VTDEGTLPQVPASDSGGLHAAPRRSSLGVWAFALSLAGLVILPIIGSVSGFVLGRVAIRKCDAGPILGGRGLAVAAVVISLVSLVTIALAIAAYALVLAYLPI